MDVGAFSVKNDGTLEELDAFQDQHLKFSSVGDNLVGLVVDLLGKTVLEKLRTTKPDEFHKFISQLTRKSVENDENEWSFVIPQSVLDIFKDNFKKSLKEKMKGYRNGNVTLSDNCLILNKEVIRELCEVTATSIEKNISESLKDSRYQAIKNVYLVGGQSKYSIYSSIFEKSFPEKKFLIPGDSHLAVVKGSVMYAQNELCILKRRLKYTYGVLQSPVFKLGQHDEKHACIDDDGVKRCLDCFVSLAIKGQVIGANEAVTKTFRPQGSLVGTTQLANIYQSTNRSPKYTSDPDCEYLGSASVLMLDKSVASNKDMEVKMWFGKPLVTMEATDNATKKVYKNVFHCLNEKNI